MTWLLNLIIYLALGAVIGWVASLIMKSGLSLLWCIIVGIVGSLIGGYVSGLLSIGGGFWITLLFAVLGACLLLLIVRLLKRA